MLGKLDSFPQSTRNFIEAPFLLWIFNLLQNIIIINLICQKRHSSLMYLLFLLQQLPLSNLKNQFFYYQYSWQIMDIPFQVQISYLFIIKELLMNPESDEMYRLMALKYMKDMGKKKKVASYLLQQDKVEQPILPLHQAMLIKKDLEKMDETYNPKKVEQYWNEFWETGKYFHADNKTTNPKKFVIPLPPPNVTGKLHIGHALTISLEDSLARWKRMSGYQTLYLPGTDHAGIATQSVVEKMLMKTQGKTRHDYTREQFLKRIWEWKDKYGNFILNQLKRTAGSMDWDRTVFTMDSNLSKAVTEAFVRLFDKGLIYRANRLVNWSTILKTAISDVEVDHQDIETRTLIQIPGYDQKQKVQFGVIIHFAYKLKDDPTKQIIVATTRIETMLGDTAVAVHPEDERYKEFIGKELVHPFIPERKMKVIADTMVQKDFGTGAVKITPAHDPNDYQCGQRNNLEFINIFTDDGLINENGGKYQGMKRFHARKTIEKDLKDIGLWKEKKNNKMRLAFCSRSGDVIEPIIRPQWWINCSEISKPMLDAVATKQLTILPPEHQLTWNRWIGDLKDWCISRQLWWGHRIPAYQAAKKGEVNIKSSTNWVVGRNHEQALQNAAKLLNLKPEQVQIIQDEDVLDTWFSSGLFPFSTLGWPNTESLDFQQFFPNSILETGHDILFFWVARMVMMSLWLTEKLPFKTVFLHPIVCDSEGNKMSKSRGNVIDPLEIIQGTQLQNLINKVHEGNLPKKEMEDSIRKLQKQFPQGIPECGSDALRFGLLAYMIQSRNINLDVKRIIGYRQFCNKIWNTFKFSKKAITSQHKEIDYSKCNFLNSWILAKLNRAIKGMNDSLEKYEFGEATNYFYNFWLYELCDVYLEATKPIFAGNNQQLKNQTSSVLFKSIETGLRLLHPLMPFLTEELYQKIPNFKDKKQSISISTYPQSLETGVQSQNFLETFATVQKEMTTIQSFASQIRSLAASVNLPPNIRPPCFILTNDSAIERQKDLLAVLAKLGSVTLIKSESDVPFGCGQTACQGSRVFVALKEYINVNKQIQRLEKKLGQQKGFVDNVLKKMDVKDYSTKIPENIRQKHKQDLDAYQKQYDLIKASLDKMISFK